MSNLIQEAKLMQLRAGIITEDELNEAVDNLHVVNHKSKEGNKQIAISVLGGGFKNNEIILSTEEAKELQKLAKEFTGNRNSKLSKAVNTQDKNHTQSTISIEPHGLKCIIARQEGSVYKGYDEESGSNTGYLEAAQSVVYQLAEEDLNEAETAPIATNTKPTNNAVVKDLATLKLYLKDLGTGKLPIVLDSKESVELYNYISQYIQKGGKASISGIAKVSNTNFARSTKNVKA